MAYSIVDNLLKCLDCLDSHEDSTPSMKYQIRTLKTDLRLLRTFLMCSACRYIEDSDAKNVSMQVEALVQNAESDFQSLYVKSIDGNKPTHMALLVSNALEKGNILKAEVTQVYATVLSSTFFDSLICGKFVAEFADCLLENLKDLREYVAADLPMNGKIISLETKLIFLKNFIRFVAKQSVENEKFQDLLTHASDVISDAAHLSYRCFVGNASEPAECRVVNDVISSLVRRIIPINCNVIHYYIPYQKKSLAVEELDAGFLDFLLDTLAELVKYNITLEDFKNYNINGLVEDLLFLKNYLLDLPERYPELVKLILIHIASITRNIAPSIFFLYTDGMKEEVVRHSTGRLGFLQEEINLIKAEVHLMSLRGSSWMTTLKDRIQILYEEVVFLQSLLNAPDYCRSLGSERNVLFTQGQATVLMVGSLIMSLSNKESNEDMLSKMEFATSVFLERTRIMKGVARDIFGRGPSKFPKTNDLGFLNSFLGNLKDLLLHKADRVPFPKHHIARVHDALEYLEKNLWDVIRQNNEHPELKNLKARVMQAAYEAEYAIDSFLVGGRNIWCSVVEMSDVVEQLKVIQAEFSDISRTVKFETVCDVRVVSSCVLSRTNAPTFDDALVVGFNDVEEIIIDGLTRGMTERDVVSIVGMPGLGKTTLAKKVFNDEKVLNYFDKRAWCYVSEVYKKKELLLEILSQVLEDVDEATKMKDDTDLAELLYRKLKRKRYLIVVDDLWDIKAWDDLQRSFPDDDNGSRIMVTTRLQDLASQVESDTKPNHPTPLRFFTVEESWELLEKKVFATDCCPRNLKEPGMRIAKNCQGLPLAVTLVAGILARTEKKESWWKEVAESISSYIVDDPNQCTVILELSYKHLPDHLKPCFLYFGEFLKHPHIPVQKLIWLWIAEGFVPQTEGKSFEGVAEDYLMDLIGRSLVMATKKRTNGSVKVCHVHDLLREYCKRKAEEENFFELIYKKDKHTFLDDLGDILEYTYSLSSEEPCTTHTQRRLCIYSQRESFVKSKLSGSQVRSLLFFGINDMSLTKPCDISPICLGFRLLKVLDLGCINVGNSFPRDIELMVQLRYLSLQGTMRSVPSTIFKLLYLETFLLKALRGEVCLPYTIWTLSRLRHLHIDARAVFGWDGYDGWNLIRLENLQTISTPSLIYDKDRAMDPNEVMRRSPNLQKLRCISMDSEDCYHFPSLEFMSRLESVKILHYGQSSLSSCKFNLPSNLKRLTLSKFRLPWSEISMIGRLPHLEVLKLLCRSFEGPQWEMRDGEFLKLKFLKLDSLNFEQWNISSDCLPSLELLVLRSCKKVKEFPSCLGDIPMLRSVELHWCCLSAVNSIISIQEEVLEYAGDEGFKVHVYPPELDSRSSPKDHSSD